MSVEQLRAAVGDVSRALGELSGLRVGDDKLPLLAELLSTRMRATGSQTADAYLELLGRDLNELARVASLASVSESYFLRDSRQFAAFAMLLRERAARGSRHVRILSAGCSTGDEAYSIAITIRETLSDADAWNISILGADLNGATLEAARRARYTAWSLRETPESIRQRYFRNHGAGYVLTPEISEMVRFEQYNLSSRSSGLWQPQVYDVVFFRNVLMYLSERAARGVIESIAASMTPGAHLFLGYAENLRGLSQSFQVVHAHETFFYRLHERAVPQVGATIPRTENLARRPLGTDWFSAIACASARIGALSLDSRSPLPHSTEPRTEPAGEVAGANAETVSLAITLITEERFEAALALIDTLPEPERAHFALLRAVTQISTGRSEAALAECAALLELNDLNAEAHFVVALCREQQNDPAAACRHSRSASYLDSNFAMPHLQLGRLARRSGDPNTARRELTLALDLLTREAPLRIALFGGGFDREALRDICRGELAACGGNR